MRNPPLAIGLTLALAVSGCSVKRSGQPVAQAKLDSLVVIPVTAAQIEAHVASNGAPATLVNVWATWCEPCKEEFPELLSVARARAKDGVKLILVSTDFPDQGSAIRAFLTARGVTDTTYLKTGDDMSFIDTLSPKWSGALPATFVYSRAGRLSECWEGRADSNRFEQALNQALTPH